MSETPRIHLSVEVEAIRYSIIGALFNHQEAIRKQIEQAVNDHCRSENIVALIRQEVNTVIDEQIQCEIKHFFRLGPGQAVIAEAVRARLEERVARPE